MLPYPKLVELKRTIRPCPHPECGSPKINIMTRYGDTHQCLCTECLMRGPDARTETSAVRLWNSLPRPTQEETIEC